MFSDALTSLIISSNISLVIIISKTCENVGKEFDFDENLIQSDAFLFCCFSHSQQRESRKSYVT